MCTYNLKLIKTTYKCVIHNCTLLTDHSCIFTVTTVVDPNSIVGATTDICLIPSAVHIIQEDRSSSRSKETIVVNLSECYCICKQKTKFPITLLF